MCLTVGGISTCSNEVQPEKTPTPISSIDDGIFIPFNEVHSLKALSPSFLIDSLITNCCIF